MFQQLTHSFIPSLPSSLPHLALARLSERAGEHRREVAEEGRTGGQHPQTALPRAVRRQSRVAFISVERTDGRTELCEGDRFRTDEVGRWADGAGGRQAVGRNDTKWNNHCTGPSGTQSNAGVRNPLTATKHCP